MSCLSNEISRHSAVWIVFSAIDHLGLVRAVLGKEIQDLEDNVVIY